MASPAFGRSSSRPVFASPDSDAAPLALRVQELRQRLAQQARDPLYLAEATGAHYVTAPAANLTAGEFHLRFWDEELVINYPDFVIRRAATTTSPASGEVNLLTQALLAYYFLDSVVAPLHGKWMAFSELPDGAFYTQAFQGYSGRELQKAFGEDMLAFAAAAQRGGGLQDSLTPYAFSFAVLPRVQLLAACWPGDEDFPTSYQILFDAAVPHHLSTEACAIVGGMLARRVIRGK